MTKHRWTRRPRRSVCGKQGRWIKFKCPIRGCGNILRSPMAGDDRAVPQQQPALFTVRVVAGMRQYRLKERP